jgi:YfiH family protein
MTVPGRCAGLRLDQALARMAPEFSRSRLARWLREGRATVDGKTAAPRQKVRGGESVTLLPLPEPRDFADHAEQLPLAIVHEDGALLVIDKPAGLVVHPGAANWRGTLLNALLGHDPGLAAVPRAGIVHRLDKDTSGLLVVARTLQAQAALVRQLAARSVRREYLALVHGRVVRDGTVRAPIGRHPRNRVRMAVVARGRDAVTHYEVIERYATATLLRCRLETGRTHQIRGAPLRARPSARRRPGLRQARERHCVPAPGAARRAPRPDSPGDRQARAMAGRGARAPARADCPPAPRGRRGRHTAAHDATPSAPPGMNAPHPDWIVPDWPVPANVRALVTTRAGGVSAGPYASFNLGLRCGDDAAAVAANRAALRALLPREPAWLRQVHGIRVAQADTPAQAEPEADAAVALRPGAVCAVLVADCVPVLLSDRAGTAVAAAHAGWRGLAAGVIENTVRAMARDPATLRAFMGPGIGPRAFEVGADVRDAFVGGDTAAASAFLPHGPGKWLADLFALVRTRLRNAGVAEVHGGGLCTHSDPRRFFSYRRDRTTGRMAALIWRAE